MTSIKEVEMPSRWDILSKSLMDLSEINYAESGYAIVSELQSLLRVQSEKSDNIKTSVLYILYERALRELVTSSFPVSANIIDALSTSADDIFGIVQDLMRCHFQELLKKLKDFSTLNCNDIGVVYLLLSIYRLDKVSGRVSSLINIIEMIIKQASSYIETYSDDSDLNIFVMILFALIHYSLQSNYDNNDTKKMTMFVRKVLIKNSDTLTNFSKVLAVDILEQCHNKKNYAELYTAIYRKIFQPENVMLPDVKEYINKNPYPLENTFDEIKDGKINEVASSIEKKSVSRNLSSSSDEMDVTEVSRKEPDGQSHSEEDEKEEQKMNEEMNKESVSVVSNGELDESQSVEKTSGEVKPTLKWSISELPEVSEKKTETLDIPVKFISRIRGYKNAIARKLEIESNTVIEICDNNEDEEEVERPATSCLTAHRLVTGCLGVPMQLPPEQIAEEKSKLSEAKIKRQTEGRKEKVQPVNITGTAEQIKHASKLISDILTCVVTIHIPLDFTVDEILDKHSGKLKTIEMLLNVFLEIEEMEDDSIVLNLTGDEQSCADAKKLVFEELGSFRSQHGHLFIVPEELIKVLKDESGLSKLVDIVQEITEARILYLLGPKGYAIFISGFPHQVNRSLQIFQKTNAELLCCLSDNAEEKEKITAKAIYDFIKQCHGPLKRCNSLRPSLLGRDSSPEESKENMPSHVYSRKDLLEFADLELSQGFPENLCDDPVVKNIVIEERHTTRNYYKGLLRRRASHE